MYDYMYIYIYILGAIHMYICIKDLSIYWTQYTHLCTSKTFTTCLRDYSYLDMNSLVWRVPVLLFEVHEARHAL